MLYFVLDEQQVLVDTFSGPPPVSKNYACPFCFKKVMQLNPAEDHVVSFIHQCHSDCRPSFEEQLYRYFEAIFPTDFTLNLPKYEHVVPAVSSELPSYPGKKIEFPSKTIHLKGKSIEVTSSDLLKIEYHDPIVHAYKIQNSADPLILIFNFFGCEIERDFFHEEIFFTSTVLEFILKPTVSPEHFHEGINIKTLLSCLFITYIRNEMMLKEIQEVHRERQAQIEEVAIKQSSDIKRLSDLSIINIKHH